MKKKFLPIGYRFAIILMLGLWVGNCAQAQIITTIAGNGTPGYSGDGGPATAAELDKPICVAIDAGGNIYFSDYGNHRIRKVTPAGTISTIAGNGTSGYSGDGGAATAAKLSYPYGVAVDGSGNVYLADYSNNRIRKVTPSGTISTIAGNGTASFSGDGGAATAAELQLPTGVAIDGSGNLYVADWGNQRIRKVTPSGTISTLAGNGTGSFSGDGGAATAAELYNPIGVAVDGSSNVYIADDGNQRIRKVTPSGSISTIAGNGTAGYSGDGGAATAAELNYPVGVALDFSGNLYIADDANHTIRKVTPSGIISTIAGNGTAGYSGDGGAATAAELNYPYGAAVDGSGNLYIADDLNQRIRKVGSCALPHAASISGTDSLCPGFTTTFTDTTTGGTWVSANPSIATVNSSGIVSSLTAGTVTILYIVSNSCGSDTAVFPFVVKDMTACPDAVTGIEHDGENSLTIYPNPNEGYFTIAGNINGTGELTFEVRDVVGRVVKTGTGAVLNEKFNVSVQFDFALNEGYYYVRIFAGGVVLARSFVVGR